MLKLVINSHIKSEHAQKLLYDNLIKLSIHKIIDIIFVVGDSNEYCDKIDENNIRWIFMLPNYIDFTGIIWSSDNLNDDDCILYLHDTIMFGSDLLFKKLNFETKRLLTNSPSMNMGTYMVSDLNRVKKILIYSIGTKTSNELKTYCVRNEDFIFKVLKIKGAYTNKSIITGPYDIYKTGVMRRQEYYEEIDLYKFKANWCKKEVYELNN